MKIIDESERLKGEVVGVSLEEEEGIRKRKGVVNNLAEQETSRLLAIVFLSDWTKPTCEGAGMPGIKTSCYFG